MLELSVKNNELEHCINNGELSARNRWMDVDASTVEFSRLQEEELLSLFFGSYQLKQSHVYLEQRFELHEEFLLQERSS